MCGIFGMAISGECRLGEDEWRQAVGHLFTLSETRGKEAAGIAVAVDNSIRIHKDATSATNMMKTREYRKLLQGVSDAHFNTKSRASLAVIGHSRLVTNGLQGIDANNQPIWRDRNILVHNGIVVNVDELWDKHEDVSARADVDTEVIAALIEKFRDQGETPAEAIGHVFDEVYGETSIAILFQDLNLLALATNTGSLYVAENEEKNGLLFVSENYICRELTHGRYQIPAFRDQPSRQIPAGNGLLINLDSLETQDFSLASTHAKPNLAPRLATQNRIEDKAEILNAYRDNLKRCSNCLLPETMPFITYDAEGVCSFCQNYTPMVRKPRFELEEHLANHRKTDGTPDCLVAFSGGRDSSYGLHLLRTQLDMTPIAFTYDWGMVTDLGRRNQARLCGKLGIEHIWVSADIKKKRDYIRRNILAWMKRPDLGMVPLMIVGDKHVFQESNKIMDQCNLDLIVYCPNKLEKTDFKTGFCGIAPNNEENQPFALSMKRQLQMIAYYGKNFLLNPAYFNRSFLDSFSGFYSLYHQARDYTYLFDYIEWQEEDVDQTIIDEYGWELSPETNCAWRIGDGTAPFYNYVYHTVAGFTEHDTFRSNQIREKQLTREQGMKLIKEENVPRWDSFREYTQMINLDFDDLVRVIDQMPKLYVPH